MVLTKRGTYVDFVTPVLKTLDSLGGRAWLNDIEQEFHMQYHTFLDPKIDWYEVTGNHGKQRWRDYCGSRVLHWQLKPNGYVTVEKHGKKGSIWEMTQRGKAKLRSEGAK